MISLEKCVVIKLFVVVKSLLKITAKLKSQTIKNIVEKSLTSFIKLYLRKILPISFRITISIPKVKGHLPVH